MEVWMRRGCTTTYLPSSRFRPSTREPVHTSTTPQGSRDERRGPTDKTRPLDLRTTPHGPGGPEDTRTRQFKYRSWKTQMHDLETRVSRKQS